MGEVGEVGGGGRGGRGEVGRGITVRVYLATSYYLLPTSGSTAGELNN